MEHRREERCAAVTELRVTSVPDSGGLPLIEGHAAVFDSLSQELGFLFPFKERIERGAFAASLQKDDVRALWNHNPNYVLGRNKAGTLELSEDERGLKVCIHPPDTTWARDLTQSIARGDVSQMSFGFTVEAEDWASENGADVRILKQVRLFDVSPVTFPAYLETDVGVRAAMDSYERHKRSQTEKKDVCRKKLEEYKLKFMKKEK